MKARRVKAIAKKELIQVWRDPRSLMIALLMPLMQMALLGYGVSLDIKHIPVCAFDREGSQRSEALLKRFQASIYFSVVEATRSYGALKDALDNGRCKIGVVIPPDFSERLADIATAPVQVVLDATDDNTANIGLGYAQEVVAGFSSDVQLVASQRQGAVAQSPPVALQSRVWFNEDLNSRNFVIPGVVAMVLALVGAQLTSLTISREWERGTMEVLISTPVTRFELMVGKILPYFAIGMLDAALCLSLAVYWFEVPFRGALATLFFTTSLFLIVVLSVGYFISVAIRSQIGASQIALLVTMMPTTLLSGFTFPIDQMPWPIQAITYLVHSRYYVTILKAVFLKGAGLIELAMPMSLLALYAVAVAFLAARAFRKTLD
ncbi:MAG: ABC transporter permease [Roseiarcus sp.]|jgi:ABC-2 type transport system permease protein